jgi:hypothetical protein
MKRRIVLLLAGALGAAGAFGVSGGFALASLVDENTPIPGPGSAGAPHRALSVAEEEQFKRGRLLFDRNFSRTAGVGPVFNGDSCRACHQDPVIGGSGGVDLQVQRPGIPDGGGGFTFPAETGPLAQTHATPGFAREEIPEAAFVEERNSPTLLGLGLLQAISDAVGWSTS